MVEKEHRVAELKKENEKMKEIIELLLAEMEKGQGKRLPEIRDKMPEKSLNKAPEPPWVREGYEDKRSWIEDKKS